MKLERGTRYTAFPRSKVFHKMGEGRRTQCGLSTTRKGGQMRMFVLYSLFPIEGKTYCQNCHQNDRFRLGRIGLDWRKLNAKEQA